MLRAAAAITVAATLVVLLAGSLSYGDRQLGATLMGLSASDGTVSDPRVMGDNAASLAAKAPLRPTPYFVRGMMEEGDAKRAEALVNHALTLNPRYVDARLWRLRRSLARGRVDVALREISILYRLRRSLSPVLGTMLAEASREPATRRDIAVRFANTPYLLDILKRGAATGLSTAQLLELLEHTDLRDLPSGIQRAQAAVIADPIRRRSYKEAHSAWSALVNRKPGPNRIFDPDFSAPDVAPPFAWTLTSDEDVQTASVPSGRSKGTTALEVQSFTDLPRIAAAQSLVLDEGRYDLSYRVRRTGGPAAPPAFVWVVRCSSTSAGVEFPIEQPGERWSETRVRFTVPVNCPLQVLELKVSGSYPGASPELLLTDVSVIPVPA